MSNTNFGLLTNEQKKVWSMDFWTQARNFSFISKFLGKDSNSIIQHVDELKKTEKGTRAVMTLVADMEGDGVTGDNRLKGNEEALKSFEQVITYDQMRNANHNEGRMAEQKTIVNFREQSKDKLAYWLADRMDQLALLTMSGVPYTMRNNGAPRIGSKLPLLEFAADVSAPSSKRVARWNGTSKLLEIGGGTSSVAAADTPMWELFVQAKAHLQEQYVRGVKEKGGNETYHVFLTPTAMAKLKLDPTYMANLRHAQTRDASNPLFSDGDVKVDGLHIHEFRHVYNTSGATAGNKWGALGAVDGCQILICGAQAMGMADIGDSEWDEETDDYKNSFGIAIAKMLGFLKPKFYSQYSGGTVQDHGIMSVYVAQ